jgi:hypothetical protein
MGAHWSPRSALAFAAVLAVLLLAFGWLIGTFDFNAFVQAARTVRGGHNPYASVQSAVFRTGHAFVYPYLVAWAFVPFTLLPTSVAVAADISFAVAVIVWGCHLLGRRGPAPAALVLVSSTTIIGLQMGTLNAFLFAGLALAWSQRDRFFVVGPVIGLVAVSKLFLIPMIAWLIATRRHRAGALAAGVFVAALSVGWLAGPVGPRGYLHLLSSLQGNEVAQSWSLTSLLHGLGAGTPGTDVLVASATLAVLLAGWVTMRRTGDDRVMFVAALMAGIMISPIVWSSYLLILDIPLLLVAEDDRALAAAALISWVLVVPDVVSPPRVVAGVGLALLLAARPWRPLLGRRRHDGPAARGWSLVEPGHYVAAGLLALMVVTLVAVGAGAVNALPVLLAMAAVGAEVTGAIRSRHRAAVPLPEPELMAMANLVAQGGREPRQP